MIINAMNNNNYNKIQMWQNSITICYKFCKIKLTDPLMLFASYPVGYPMLKKLHSYYKDI